MKQSRKRTLAVDALANGETDVCHKLKVPARTFSSWMADPDFVEAVELKQAEVARLKRWGLMSKADAMIKRINEASTGGPKLTTSEQKSMSEVLKSLGILRDVVPQPMPLGEIKIELGSKKQPMEVKREDEGK